MSSNADKEAWDGYWTTEVSQMTPVLLAMGYSLDAIQPHVQGERYLMQALTTASGKKTILLGQHIKDGVRVVIKMTADPSGMSELTHERECRSLLHNMKFAYQIFNSPDELFFGKRNGRLISIQKFIDQESTFLARPLIEQFSLLLAALKAQEGAHATTFGHDRFVRKVFGAMDANGYLKAFAGFRKNIQHALPQETSMLSLLVEAENQLLDGSVTIEQYGGFLTHTDFVPHNIRVRDGKIYLLDYSSLRFGNKYEGWARLVNFMTLYNPPLAEALVAYVRLNKTPEELQALKLMRLYRLGEIIWYYTGTLPKSTGNLHLLNEARIRFWTRVLESVLTDQPLPHTVVNEYQHTRDSLRSEDEKLRQKDLH